MTWNSLMLLKTDQSKLKEKYYCRLMYQRNLSKGLKLCIHRDTGSKYFWLQFWFNGKADYYSVGKFIPGSWGVNDVEDKLFQ